jgi:hypothetical protein
MLDEQRRHARAADRRRRHRQAGRGWYDGRQPGGQALPVIFVPADLAITGIIDEIDDRPEFRQQRATATWTSSDGA